MPWASCVGTRSLSRYWTRAGPAQSGAETRMQASRHQSGRRESQLRDEAGTGTCYHIRGGVARDGDLRGRFPSVWREPTGKRQRVPLPSPPPCPHTLAGCHLGSRGCPQALSHLLPEEAAPSPMASRSRRHCPGLQLAGPLQPAGLASAACSLHPGGGGGEGCQVQGPSGAAPTCSSPKPTWEPESAHGGKTKATTP